MGLETGKFIAALNAAWPLPEDGKDQGDDHIRKTKETVQNSFTGFPGAVLAGGVDVGVSNAYQLNPPIALQAYSVNMTVLWLPANTNGGASTINISGLGPQPIRRIDGTALANGDIMAGNPVVMLYNGSEFRMVAMTVQQINQLVFAGTLPGQSGNAGKPLITDGTSANFSNAFGVAMDEAKGAPIAAATTVNLTSAAGTGNFVHITGSATISAITLASGASRDLVFDGAPILVNSSNLILPTGASITVQAGDAMRVRGEGAGVVRVVEYQRKNGRALTEPQSPGLVYLATVVPVQDAVAIDFLNVFSSDYDDYLLAYDGISYPQVNLALLRLQLAKNAVLDTTASYGAATSDRSGSGNAPSQTSFLGIVDAGNTFTNTGGLPWRASGSIRFTNMNDTRPDALHVVASDGAQFSSAAVLSNQTLGGHSNLTAPNTLAISGFRLFWDTAGAKFNAGGTIRIYGYRKT